MKKLIICVLLCISIVMPAYAQEKDQLSFSGSITNFLSWIKNLDNAISSINEKEKLRKVYRLIGYINLDLDNLQGENFIFAVGLNKVNIDKEDLKSQLSQITKDNSKLMIELNDLAAILNQTSIDFRVNGVRNQLVGYSTGDLSNIDNALSKQLIDKKKVLDEANQCKAKIESVNSALSKLRDKVLLEIIK
jgi:regulator of replication initiation timing